MATIRGESGSTESETGSGTLATVIGTRSWSLSITKETLDTTDPRKHFPPVHRQHDQRFWAPRAGLRPGCDWSGWSIEDIIKSPDTADASSDHSPLATQTALIRFLWRHHHRHGDHFHCW